MLLSTTRKGEATRATTQVIPTGGEARSAVPIWTHDPQAHGTFLQFVSLRACVQLIKGIENKTVFLGTLRIFTNFLDFCWCSFVWLAASQFFGKLFQGYTQGYTWQICLQKNRGKICGTRQPGGFKLLETRPGFSET